MNVVNIIGAGPVGCCLAYLLSDKFHVNVYEEHDEIGKPVHCTGIVTDEINRIIKIPESVILHRINKIRIKTRKNFVDINLKKPDIILDREKFDLFLHRKAKEKGVNFFLGHKLVKISKDKIFFKKKEQVIEKEKCILIGCDGPRSLVSRHLGNKNDFLMGIQAVIKESNEFVSVFPGVGRFAWKVPFSEGKSKIGVMADVLKAREIFGNLVEGKKVLEIHAGLIPVYNKKETFQKGSVYIAGDAASLVKATTGGGLVPGLKSAVVLADCIKNNKNYRKSLKKIRRELGFHLLAGKILGRMEKSDFEKLVEKFSKEKNKRIIESIGRDSLTKIIPKVLISEPGMMRYLFM